MSKLLYKELKRITLGEKLGEGSARSVYTARMNDGYVIKVERAGGSFQNVAEWEIWKWVEHKPMAKWFAPVQSISPCGIFLLMRQVEPLRKADLPKKLPFYLCDLKIENFGMLEGRVVACDYGTVMSCIQDAPQKLVPAKWD